MPAILPIIEKNRAIQTLGTIIGIDKYAFSFQFRPGQIYSTATGGFFFKEQLTSCEVMAPNEQNPQIETFVITN